MATFKFNVGDKVAISSTIPSHRSLNNLVGEVTRTYRSRDGIKYGVTIPNHPNLNSENRLWWVTDDELVMVRPLAQFGGVPKAYYEYCNKDVKVGIDLAQNIPCYVPKKVIFAPPKTIVLWEDGTKAIVVCAEGYQFDPYAGFCAAVAKRNFGTNSQIKKVLENAEYREGKMAPYVRFVGPLEDMLPSDILAEIGEKLKKSGIEAMNAMMKLDDAMKSGHSQDKED